MVEQGALNNKKYEIVIIIFVCAKLIRKLIREVWFW